MCNYELEIFTIRKEPSMNESRHILRAVTPVFLLLCTVMLTISVSPVSAGNRSKSGIIPLNEEEAVALTYMREEEKLARDVYLVMDEYWGSQIFAKIAVPEQQHMDTMKTKLDKYGLPDPALPYYGSFTNTFLQEKYDELVAKDLNHSSMDSLSERQSKKSIWWIFSMPSM
jgi:hypothetical protein